jgi:hypothetical protein
VDPDTTTSVNARNKGIVYFEKGVSVMFSWNMLHQNNFYVISEDASLLSVNAAVCGCTLA